MFDGRFRKTVDRSTEPVGRALQRAGVTADMLTATGLLSATGAAIAIGAGLFPLAIGLLILTGAHDLFDGAVAKAAGTVSVRGAFFDSVTDRMADALLLGGVAWYLISHGGGHVVLLPFAILSVTFLVSYERAKAESLGIPAKGGLMERAERMILLGIALLSAAILVPVLWVLFVLTTLTAAGRFQRIWVAAGRPDRSVPSRPRSFVRRPAGAGARVQDRSFAAVARWRTVRIEARSRARGRREAREHRRANRTHSSDA
ncbi:MAG TPA: CDP-alcohol phosphatidyltransferase family protein [Acidimicrobiales bacterium]